MDWVVHILSCRQANLCSSAPQLWPWVKVTERSSSTFPKIYTFFVPDISKVQLKRFWREKQRLFWWRRAWTCIIKLKRWSIGSDNGLSPVRRRAIIWINTGLFLFVYFSGIRIKIQRFSWKIWVCNCRLQNGGHFVPASSCTCSSVKKN